MISVSIKTIIHTDNNSLNVSQFQTQISILTHIFSFIFPSFLYLHTWKNKRELWEGDILILEPHILGKQIGQIINAIIIYVSIHSLFSEWMVVQLKNWLNFSFSYKSSNHNPNWRIYRGMWVWKIFTEWYPYWTHNIENEAKYL